MLLTLEIPDQYIQGQNQNQIALQIKLYAALLMLQSGQLPRGAACEFAGVDICDFFALMYIMPSQVRVGRLFSPPLYNTKNP